MRRAMLAASALLAAVPASAAAAAPAATVATATTPDGVVLRLQARDSSHGLCLTVVGGDFTHEKLGCERPPGTARAAARAIGMSWNGDRVIMAGMTTAATATLDLRFNRRGRRVDVPTVPGAAYTGRFQGRARFYLAAFPSPAPVYARLLSASGRLLRASDLDPFRRTPVRGPVTVSRGRVSGRPYRATIAERSFLAPRPGRPEHRHVETCLEFSGPTGGGGVCGALPRHRATLNWSGSCANGAILVYGTAPHRAARVELGLRGGRTRSVATRRLPHWPELGGVRAYAARVRHARSLRRVVARDRHGRRLGPASPAEGFGHGPARGGCGGGEARKALG